MSLVLTRRSGESLVFSRNGGATSRLHIISIEGNTVRLAIDAPDDVTVLREELMHPSQRPTFPRRSSDPGTWGRIAALMATSFALHRLFLLTDVMISPLFRS